jgi:hypothetical protein
MAQRSSEDLLQDQEIKNIKDQLHRLSSHVESEQRVYGETSKRVTLLEKVVDVQQKLIDKLDSIVRNGNGGLQLRVDRIEQREDLGKQRLTMWLAIASGAVGLLSLVLQMTDKL